MDRDKELIAEFKKMMANLRRSIEGEVEGDWYLREIVWEDGREVRIVSSLRENGTLDGCGSAATIENMQKWGWKITPVTIFRKDKENAVNQSYNRK